MHKKIFFLSLFFLVSVVFSGIAHSASVVSANGFACKGYADGSVLCSGAFSFSPDTKLSVTGQEYVVILAENGGTTYSYSSRNGCLCEGRKDPKTQGEVFKCQSKEDKTHTFSAKEKISSLHEWCLKN